ncbi:hypothetical protein ACIQAC_29675 [Streptomyces sp. NPDC088387]|uniref:hypothetical protein n=1 Tax=Streptomyces sp. NPDC088387 TaxID=3365859 RepID=UPI0038259C5B
MQAAALASVVGTLVGCSASDGSKEYDVPEALCGVSVDQDLVSELLPAGTSISVEEKNPVPSRTRCQVNIDGKAALIASQMWWEKGTDRMTDVADSIPELDSAEPADDDSVLYSGTGALRRVTSCSNADHPDHTFFTSVQVYGDGVDDAEATAALISAYTQALEGSGTCR